MEGEICDLKPIVAVAKKYKVSCCVYASAGAGDRRLLTVMTRLVTRSTLLLLRGHSLRRASICCIWMAVGSSPKRSLSTRTAVCAASVRVLGRGAQHWRDGALEGLQRNHTFTRKSTRNALSYHAQQAYVRVSGRGAQHRGDRRLWGCNQLRIQKAATPLSKAQCHWAGIRVPGRGAQHRGNGADGAGRDGAPGRGPGRHRRHDGHLHQVLRLLRRLPCRLQVRAAACQCCVKQIHFRASPERLAVEFLCAVPCEFWPLTSSIGTLHSLHVRARTSRQ